MTLVPCKPAFLVAVVVCWCLVLQALPSVRVVEVSVLGFCIPITEPIKRALARVT